MYQVFLEANERDGVAVFTLTSFYMSCALAVGLGEILESLNLAGALCCSCVHTW